MTKANRKHLIIILLVSFSIMVILGYKLFIGNKYTDSKIKVLSGNYGKYENVVTYLDEDLNIIKQSHYKAGSIATNWDNPILKDNHVYGISSKQKDNNFIQLNLNNGYVYNYSYAQAKAIINNYAYTNTNLVGKNAITRFDLTSKQKSLEKPVDGYIFKMVNYQNRLFAFTQEIDESKDNKDRFFVVEYDVNTLEEVSKLEIKDFAINIEPIINKDILYYIDSNSSTLNILDMKTNKQTQTKINIDYLGNMKLYNDKLYFIPDTFLSEKDKNIIVTINLSNLKQDKISFSNDVTNFMLVDDKYYILHPNTITIYDKELKIIKEVKNLENDDLFNVTFLQ